MNVWQRRPINCLVAVTTATFVGQYPVTTGLPRDLVRKLEIHEVCWEGTFDNLHIIKFPTRFNACDGPLDEDVGRPAIIGISTIPCDRGNGPRMPCAHLDGNVFAHVIEEGLQGAMQICTQDANIGLEK